MAKKQNDKELYGFQSLGVSKKTYELIDAVNKETGKPKYRIVHEAVKYGIKHKIFDIQIDKD